MEIQREDDEYLWGTCLNPQHKDTNASLCINKTDSGKYKRGYGYCYSCGFTIQFSEEAIKKISNKKSIARKKVPVDWKSLTHTFIREGIRTGKVFELEDEWNIDDFYENGIGWDGEAWTMPMQDSDWNIVGINRRFPNGSKLCIHGSQLGLFLPMGGVSELYESIIVCEGFSDTAIARHLGYSSIGKPSAGFGEQIIREFLENEGYKGKIIIVQDNDSAGKRSRIKLQDALKDWETKVVVPETDLKDYYLMNGANTTRALLKM